MTEKTNLVLANKSDSLRTTIPASIVRQFGLEVKDQMYWNLEIIDNKMKIVLEPVKANKKTSKKSKRVTV